MTSPIFLATRLSPEELLIEQGTLSIGAAFNLDENWHLLEASALSSTTHLLELVPLGPSGSLCAITVTGIICFASSTGQTIASHSFNSQVCKYAYYEYKRGVLIVAVQTLETIQIYTIKYDETGVTIRVTRTLPPSIVLDLGKIHCLTIAPQFITICSTSTSHGKKSMMTTLTVIEIGEEDAEPDTLVSTSFQLQGRPKTIQFDKSSQLIIVLKRGDTYYFFRYKFVAVVNTDGVRVVRGELLSEPQSGMQYQFRSCITKHSVLYAGRYPNYVCIECRKSPRSCTLTAHCEFASEREVLAVSNTPNGTFVVAVDPGRTRLDLYYNYIFSGSMNLLSRTGPLSKAKGKLLGCAIIPHTYRVLAYTSAGAIAIYQLPNAEGGLFHVFRSLTVPLASYAIEKSRQAILLLYDTHYVYLAMRSTGRDELAREPLVAWCPNPAQIPMYSRIFEEDRGPMEVTGFAVSHEGDMTLSITLRFRNEDTFIISLALREGEYHPDVALEMIRTTVHKEQLPSQDTMTGDEGCDVTTDSEPQEVVLSASLQKGSLTSNGEPRIAVASAEAVTAYGEA
ncbi:hypothetical protein GMRT_15546 [Giardia muris]|uniref:Uncharacterized protein n=1 Tax=Giardia muris TaxID=5742 RepID=A0A4Z1SSE2_GIAMU|nr:hypothetical protein GMRT_15546 [Giardia muris]|eukprot:TNJ28862.1 hypothetical protein GMRT_15546 [Giardia muris]